MLNLEKKMEILLNLRLANEEGVFVYLKENFFLSLPNLE